jgi:DNA-binding transcriptional ArsR family regulator
MTTQKAPAPLAVLHSTAQVATVMDPVRLEILALLRSPNSAAAVARKLKMPRQRVGYHIRELRKAGLIHAAGERRTGNYFEQLLQASALQYVVGPEALGELGANTAHVRDRFSSAYLVAVAARTVTDVALLEEQARDAGKRLPTLTLETEVHFGTPDHQQAFATELADCLKRLVAKHHADSAPHGRRFRFVVSGHPAPPAR